jgi:hypothetical protein
MWKRVRCPHGNHEFEAEFPDIGRRMGRYLRVRKDAAHVRIDCPQCKKPVDVPQWMIPELPNSPGPRPAENQGGG